MAEQDNPLLAIGAISKATGIPVETLRTWERRYGFPHPERSESGHRTYRASVIRTLRLIDAALNTGLRPSKVVGKTDTELHEILGLTEFPGTELVSVGVTSAAAPDVIPWMDAVLAFDGEELDRLMRLDWNRLGAKAFLSQRVAAFLEAIGAAWFENRADIAHEHFASERVRDFLTSRWRPMSDANHHGPIVICANLPSESHNLGLQIATTALAFAGSKVIYLGSDTPVANIASAAKQASAVGVVVSISVTANPSMTQRALTDLAAVLDESIQLVVGGRGAPAGIDRVTRIASLDQLLDWTEHLPAQHSTG